MGRSCVPVHLGPVKMEQWLSRQTVVCGRVTENRISTSYNMAARALADLSHEGAKRPSAINQLSARAAML